MYSFFRISLYFFILFVTGLSVRAHTANSGSALTFTNESAVEWALTHNASLSAARLAITEAEGRVRDAGKLDNPSLRLGYSSDRFFNNAGEQEWEVGVEQRFPVTRRLSYLKQIAAEEIRLAQIEVADRERTLREEVELLMVEAVHLSQQRELQKQLSSLLQTAWEKSTASVQRGEITSREATAFLLAHTEAQQTLETLEYELHEAYDDLLLLMMLPAHTKVDWQLTMTLPDTLFGLTEDYRDVRNHPVWQHHEQLLTIAEKQVSVAFAERWGDIALEFFFRQERSERFAGGLENDEQVGVQVSIPLPLHQRKQGALAARHAGLRKSAYDLLSVGASLTVKAEELVKKVALFHQQALHYREQILPSLESQEKEMQASYERGEIAYADWVETQKQTISVQQTYLEKARLFHRALVQWQSATAQNQTR